tara:strand:- start:174 stop:422 length:249 start_codon:yes stop_codon:yes gene_type:complete
MLNGKGDIMKIHTSYTLADHINLDIAATVLPRGNDYVVDELEVLHNGEHTDISRIAVYPFASLKPISVEEDIINLVLGKVHD